MNNSVNKILEIIRKNSNPRRILLFGSRTKTVFDENSDYDICVLFDELLNKRELSKTLYKELVVVPESVDLILEEIDKFEQLKNNKFMIYKDISRGIVLYES